LGTRGHEAEVWDEIAAKGVDIGHNVVIRYYRNHENERAGLLLYHRHADGSVCGGAVPFDVPATPVDRPRWKVDCWEPLTLSPSIEDRDCSEHLHGHVVAGRWVPCC
jgi:hypothetical protein